MTEYFELRRVTVVPTRPVFASAACIDCSLCGRNIAGSGGPCEGPVCFECADVVIRGDAVGAIKWTQKETRDDRN